MSYFTERYKNDVEFREKYKKIARDRYNGNYVLCIDWRHGMRNTGTWKSWCNMKTRVLNKNCKDYRYYEKIFGEIEPRWFSFVEFYKDMGKRPEGLTLDRIDNSSGYFPWNCRWATRKQQANNKVQSNGNMTKLLASQVREIARAHGTLRKIAKEYGVGQTTIFNIKHGISWKEVVYE